jgi:hypothetical protein
MPAPTTAAEFLDLVHLSELVPPERLPEVTGHEYAETPRQMASRLVSASILTRFQAEQLLLGKYRGFTLGKYRVLERIGHGGNGTVYLCEHQIVRSKVAIKVLPTNRAESPTALTRFYREARAAGALDHPNLVKARDVDQENGLHFLVMDFVNGANLQELVTRCGPLKPLRAAHYVAQAARGLEAAHAAGLVHRDVKPGNLLLDRHGVIRVSDLGLARFHCADDDPLTLRYQEQWVLGTADYVAPEQALNSHEVDGRADIYSLGATFYFLLTGRPPFPEGKTAKKLMAHQVREPVPVRQLRPGVPAEMAAVVARMMAKRPEQRYQSPAEVVAALEAWTATPIGPPLPEEMPQLCPAAYVGADEREGVSPRPPRTARPARPSAQGHRTSRAVAEAPVEPGGFRTPPARGPVQATRRTAQGTARRSDSTISKQQTPPHLPAQQPPPARRERPAAPRRPARGPRHWGRALLGPWGRRAAGVLVLGIVTGFATRWTSSPRASSTAPTAPPTPTLVVRPAGGDGAFSTVAAALRQARPGDRILVKADTWDEALNLRQNCPNVSIEGSSSSGPVRWRVPVGHPPGRPLVRIAARQGISLSGIAFDGAGRVDDLVILEGESAGVILRNLRVQGFRRAGVVLRGGTTSQSVTLQAVRISADARAAAGLSVEATPGEVQRNVIVQDCRLEGPYAAAVLLHGPASLAFRNNRVYNAEDGILYRKATPAGPLDLQVQHNTFCGIGGVGLHFETMPPAGGSDVTVSGNLFARTTTLARVDDVAVQPERTAARWIWVPDARGTAGADVRGCFRKTFTIAGTVPAQAVLNVACDASFTAWLNGVQVGRGEFRLPVRVGEMRSMGGQSVAGRSRTTAVVGGRTLYAEARRVYAFNVAGHLRPGVNVLAVEGSGPGGMRGLLAELTGTGAATAVPLSVASDATWKAAADAAAGWQRPDFKDAAWAAAVEIAPYGKGDAPWQGLVWDTVVPENVRGQPAWLSAEPTGNICDRAGAEGFPLLKAPVTAFELATDPDDDAHFLRYPRPSPLGRLGAPGVGPVAVRLPEDPLEAGRMAAARCDWASAVMSYRAVPREHPTAEGRIGFESAAVLLLAGQRFVYRDICSRMVDRQGRAPQVRAWDVARACTLAADSGQEPAWLEQLAHAELLAGEGQPWSLTLRGALAYRAGRFEEAVALLQRSLQAEPAPGKSVVNWLWLAMANSRLGRADEARQWLNKATMWMDQQRDGWSADVEQAGGPDLAGWLEANVLRREAEDVMP